MAVLTDGTIAGYQYRFPGRGRVNGVRLAVPTSALRRRHLAAIEARTFSLLRRQRASIVATRPGRYVLEIRRGASVVARSDGRVETGGRRVIRLDRVPPPGDLRLRLSIVDAQGRIAADTQRVLTSPVLSVRTARRLANQDYGYPSFDDSSEIESDPDVDRCRRLSRTEIECSMVETAYARRCFGHVRVEQLPDDYKLRLRPGCSSSPARSQQRR